MFNVAHHHHHHHHIYFGQQQYQSYNFSCTVRGLPEKLILTETILVVVTLSDTKFIQHLRPYSRIAK